MSRARLGLAGLGCVLLAACGQADQPARRPDVTPAPPAPPAAVESSTPALSVDAVGAGTLATPSDGGPCCDSEPLEFRARPLVTEVSRGDPVRVRISVRNTSTDAVSLVGSERDLWDALELLLDGSAERAAALARSPAAAVAGERRAVTEIAPGQAVSATVDVARALHDAIPAGGGRLGFRMRFRATLVDADAAFVSRGTTRDAELESAGCEVEFVPTEAGRARGVGGPTEDRVRSVLSRVVTGEWTVRRGADTVCAQGSQALHCLAHLTESLDSQDAAEARLGGAAVEVAREIGVPCVAYLAALDDAARPARDFVLRVIAADRAEHTDADDDERRVRDVAAGIDAGSLLSVTVVMPGQTPLQVNVDGRGVLSVARGRRADLLERHARALPPETANAVRQSFVDARLTCWAAIRTRLRPGEGQVHVVLIGADGSRQQLALARVEALKDNPVTAAPLRGLLELARLTEAEAKASTALSSSGE